MSGNHHKPDRNEPEDELESLLKQLQPSPLSVEQLDGLSREYERVATVQANAPGSVQWKRLIPLVAACGLFMSTIALYQFGFRFTRGISEQQAPPTLASPSALPSEKPLRSSDIADRFVPVSSQGQLIQTSSQGVVETEAGLKEKLELEYEDSYHWRDPSTGTNIRFISPRSEELTVPLHSH